MFHLLLTEVSVQRAPVSLACWVGIPGYLVLILCFIYYWLKYKSRELLSPLVAGLESQFIYFLKVSFIYYWLKYQSGSSCLPCLLGWNPSLSSFNSKFHLLLTVISVQGAPVSLACWVGIPVYLVLIVSFIYYWLKYQSGSFCLSCLLGWNPSLCSFNSKFLVLLTEVSVQGVAVSLGCWVGIPVYLVLILCFIYYWLKYKSRELLSPLLAGLESQFIYFLKVSFIYYWLKYQSGSSCLPCLLGWNPSLSSFNSKFHLLLTVVSVQGAPVSLACSVGIPVYLVLIVSFIYYWLKYQSGSFCLPCLLGWNPSLSSFNSKFLVLLTEVSVQGVAVSLGCWVGIPVYLVLIVCFIYYWLKYQSRSFCLPCLLGWNPSLCSFNSKFLCIVDWSISPGSCCLPWLLGWNPSLSSFNIMFHLLLTEV